MTNVKVYPPSAAPEATRAQSSKQIQMTKVKNSKALNFRCYFDIWALGFDWSFVRLRRMVI